MSDHSSSLTGDALDRALRDASTPKRTRRWLLERAAVGAAGIAIAGAVMPADALAEADKEPKPRDSVHEWGVFASTTEALTLTILTELLRRASLNSVPSPVSTIFDGVYAAELDHWNYIHKVFRASANRFWIPDGFFGGPGDALDLTAVGQAVAAGEHLFVNTYLLGVTIAATAGKPRLARYAAELAGVESEHRVLGQSLAGASPPNNLGFEVFELSTVGALEKALVGAGIGLGRETPAPGRFYDLPKPPMSPPVPISGNTPTQAIVAEDVDRAARFYSDVLGVEIVLAGEPTVVALANSWIIINVGGGPTEDKPDVTLEPPRDLDRVSSFLNIRVADIETTYRTWSERGAQFLTPPIDRGSEIRCYLRDPEGHLIELGQSLTRI